MPHIQLVSGVKDAFARRCYAVGGERFSVSDDSARLFGTLDLIPTSLHRQCDRDEAISIPAAHLLLVARANPIGKTGIGV